MLQPILIVLVVVLATAFAIGGKTNGLTIAGVSIGMMAAIALILVLGVNLGGDSSRHGGSGRPGGGSGGDGGGGC
ncbi:MAG: hypothetical protein ACRDLN_05780 [Solirubrobacteraceae bacterium]